MRQEQHNVCARSPLVADGIPPGNGDYKHNSAHNGMPAHHKSDSHQAKRYQRSYVGANSAQHRSNNCEKPHDVRGTRAESGSERLHVACSQNSYKAAAHRTEDMAGDCNRTLGGSFGKRHMRARFTHLRTRSPLADKVISDIRTFCVILIDDEVKESLRETSLRCSTPLR